MEMVKKKTKCRGVSMEIPTRSEYESKNYCSLLSFRWGLSSNGLQIVIVPGASNVHCFHFHKSSLQLCCRFFCFIFLPFFLKHSHVTAVRCVFNDKNSKSSLPQWLSNAHRMNLKQKRKYSQWNWIKFPRFFIKRMALNSYGCFTLLFLPSCACPLMMMLNYTTFSPCMHSLTHTYSIYLRKYKFIFFTCCCCCSVGF